MSIVSSPRIALLYHFMYPDDVVSAHHFDGLADNLVRQGWEVEALPCNRSCRNPKQRYPRHDTRNGVRYQRIWRPNFRQASIVGRLLNSAWMLTAWIGLVFRSKKNRPDVILIGSDPVFAVLLALPLKLFAPKIKVVHWCFDLHPEATVAIGVIKKDSIAVRLIRGLMKKAYARCDLIADLGPCMRSKLRAYDHNSRECELPPWALSEPEFSNQVNPKVRAELFGEAKLGILYSGNFGKAHSCKDLLALARLLRGNPDIHFCFAVRGNSVDDLRAEVQPEDTNISFAGFAPFEELAVRLGAADIHAASLRQDWAGIALPSKVLGSLAAGRPTIFSGPRDSAIATWIDKYNLGWTLDEESLTRVAAELETLAKKPERLIRLKENCHGVYHNLFSERVITDNWNKELRALL